MANKIPRARAKAALMGLSIDTSLTPSAHNSENATINMGAGSKGKLAMVSGNRNNQSPEKPKWKGLNIDTKLANEVENAGSPVDAKMTRKASNANYPRLSEAMLNTDWRNRRQGPSENAPCLLDDALWSAPPDRVKFADHIQDKPVRGDEKVVIDYDHGLERVAYRSRRPDEVKPELIPFTTSESVSADLCLSAPATKLEFSEAELGGEERSKKYDPSVFQPSVKSIVRLDQMVPTKRAGYEKVINWDEQTRDGPQDVSSIATVTPVSLSSNWELDFPYAEIRAVSGNKKFQTGLNEIEETVRKQLSTLVEPQTAGLPPDYIRKEYEEIREERRKAMAIANSALEARGREQDADSKCEKPDEDGEDNVHFSLLLGKLNKLCAPRIRAYTVGDKGDTKRDEAMNEADNKENDNDNSKRAPSRDSGISGMSTGGRQRSSTLNPEASEFRVPVQEKKSPIANGNPSDNVGSKETITLVCTSPETEDPIQKLETRVAELEAKLAQHNPDKAQVKRQKSAFGGRKRSAFEVKGYGPPVPHQHAPNKGFQGMAGYQPAQPVVQPVVQPIVQPIAPYQPQPGFAMGPGGMQHNPMPGTAHYGLAANAGFPPSGMPAMPAMPVAINNPYVSGQPVAPVQGPPIQGPPIQGPPILGGSNPAATAPGTPLWVKSVFGPKPVSKPSRPFPPGDGNQAMRQQQYEEYLEHLRATDPSYALRCKQRQARRADRQRVPAQDGVKQPTTFR
ncbi:hypothetical protein GGR50DRAFT_690537 [Xylaria sp. CBS 124048]|nr:hypothetical protein GGR50DRAFT_690537 [Xylaria sp. CBS 124048]